LAISYASHVGNSFFLIASRPIFCWTGRRINKCPYQHLQQYYHTLLM
jgi:hypothetical protein